MTKVQRQFRDAILKEGRRLGIPVKTIHVEWDQVRKKEVEQYIQKIETAHKRAGKSKLVFK